MYHDVKFQPTEVSNCTKSRVPVIDFIDSELLNNDTRTNFLPLSFILTPLTFFYIFSYDFSWTVMKIKSIKTPWLEHVKVRKKTHNVTLDSND